jgi:molybdopterin converting factor small subunit
MSAGKSIDSGKVWVTVKLSGWLATYFPATDIQFLAARELDKALPELMAGVMAQALTPIPQGGLMVTINGQNVNKLDRSCFQLKENDVISLIPVVAGG